MVRKLALNRLANTDISSVCRVIVEESQKSVIPDIEDNTLFKDLLKDHEVFHESMTRTRMSVVTQDARKADRNRDDAIMGIQLSIEALTYSADEEKRSKADLLGRRLEKYIGIQNLPDTQETTAIKNMLIELKSEENAPLVTELGLQVFVNELEAANQEFDRLWNLREEDVTQFRNSIAATKLRSKVEDSINRYYDWVVYNSLYSEVEGWKELQKEIYSRYLTIRQKYQ